MTFQPKAPILAISLKLYFSHTGTLRYLEQLASLTTTTTNLSSPPIQIIFIPDFLALAPCVTAFHTSSTRIHYGAQDGHWEDQGAWTGEVSMRNLREVGCAVVELGHAERRKHFGETDEVVGRKCRAAVRNDLVPIICIGEPTQTGLTESMEVLKSQLADVFRTTSPSDHLILAYEPVWAIGQPVPAPTPHIVEVARALKGMLKGEGRKQSVKVLYGGSAGPGMWEEIKDSVDGLFLGRFAHEIGNVRQIMREMEEGLVVE